MVLAVVQHGPANIEKPPEVVRGAASRLPWAWDGLCFAVPFNDPTRDSARDLVYNIPPQTVHGTLRWVRDNRGNPAAYLDSSSFLDYPDTPAHNRPSTEVTAYVRFRRVGISSAGSSGGIFLKVFDQNTAQPEISWYIQQSDAGTNTLEGSLGVNDTQNPFGYDPSFVLDTTTWVSVFIRWRSSEAPQLDILGEHGQWLGGDVGPALTGTIPYVEGQPIRINAGPQATLLYNCAYSQCMLWSRRLTDAEVQALVTDPYGWYSPHRETVILSSLYPIIWATTFRVIGYAMFATTGQRDALRAELQTWLDKHVAADVWASGLTIPVGPDGDLYDLPAGFDTPDLMDQEDSPGGPWPGLTWAFETATKELRDSFGSVPGLGSVWADHALTGSTFGESTA